MKRSARIVPSCFVVSCLLTSMVLQAQVTSSVGGARDHEVLLRDITDVEGVRDNLLVGYGLVTGLQGTGDRQQTYFPVQTLANELQRMGVQINAAQVVVKNIAAVFVTAKLPAFASPGMKIDVTVSSVGDAKSLQGGVLLLTSLRAPDGHVYAEAQGPLVLGGYSESAAGNVHTVNMPTTGRIPNGGIVEREVSVDLSQMHTVSLLLRSEDFTAARDAAAAINANLGHPVAAAIDGRHISIDVGAAAQPTVPLLIARVQNLAIHYRPPARVIIDERTGTIVLGGDVKLSPVSLMQGDLTVDVSRTIAVSQPGAFSNGTTAVVPETTLAVKDQAAQSLRLDSGANVDDLVRGMHAIGATAHDIVAILQAVKAAGGLEADLEVI